jgi:feruloyl esterase
MTTVFVRMSLLVLALTAGTALAAAAPDESLDSQCAALTRYRIPGSTLEIQKAERQAATATTPAYCKVEGTLEPHTGRDNKPYAIGFAVALPESWNGRFLFQGGGGLNGSVNPPLGAQAAGDRSALARGFAVASTDSGHRSAGFDSSFFDDQQAALNFLYQAIGKVNTVARQLIVTHYRRPIAHTYFVGCSTGGREALLQAQRQPLEFDGIIAGAPAMRTNYSNLATRWVTTALNNAAPKDAAGKSLTAQALSAADRKLVISGLLKACDGLDGVNDGMVFNMRGCRFDPAALACKAAKNDSCLSNAQVAALKQAFAGPVTSRGLQVYPGFPWDTGIAASGAGIPGLLNGGMSPVGPSPTGTTMDVDTEAHVAHDGIHMLGDANEWGNLGSFVQHGSKLILFHGVSDPWFSANDTVRYYERLAKDNPQQPVSTWSRMFLVPGMGHCRGGDATLDNFDLVTALVDWVEAGKAPQQVTATGTAFAGRSRPLCAWPTHAQFNGTGNSEDAANFSCRE